MIEVPDITPAAELPKLLIDGEVLPARLSTTDEQLHEAVRRLSDAALTAGATQAAALVHWSRYPASRVSVRGHVEHLTLPTGVETVWVPDRIVEHTPDGHELPRDEPGRLARLRSELAAMREHAAGPTE